MTAVRRNMATKLTALESGVWPDLVGQMWFEAEKKIRRQFPHMTIQVLPQGSFVRKEFSPDRVKIIVNGDGQVVRTPSIG